MTCDGTGIIHTIGHSTRSLEVFLDLLTSHQVALLIDVRRWPMSRRHPHFNRESLSAALAEKAIGYLWRQDLGGFRKPAADSPNSAWQVASFRGYADFMLTSSFAAIMREIEPIAAEQPSALMCAEAVPWQCHRQLLADAFLVRGWHVRHILHDGCSEHKLTAFARPEGTRIIYSGLI
jgi:uncharacterized protein (DUF488 family)